MDKPQFAGLRWPGSTRVVVLGQGVGDHVLAIRSCVRISLSSSVLHAAAYLVLNDPSHLLHKCVQFLRIGLNEETRSQFAHRLRLLLCSRIWPHGHYFARRLDPINIAEREAIPRITESAEKVFVEPTKKGGVWFDPALSPSASLS